MIPWTGISLGPDHGVVCTVYVTQDCKGKEGGKLEFPGTGDLGKWGLANGNPGAERDTPFGSWTCKKK
jgi:hypothetical protein